MTGTIKVLLVEDEQIDQMAFTRFVKREGLLFDAVIASSIPEARNILEHQTFDVILVDYFLGKDTAFDLLEVVKDIPCIVITGLGDEEVAVKAMKLGASDYLAKDPSGNYLKTLPTVAANAIRLKRAETELDQYRKNLEQMVVERTEELTRVNQQLNQSVMQLEAKNAELERFTYTASHDLKSPLVTINGFLGYLEKDAISGNWDRFKLDMQRVQEAVNKMHLLLDNLLELSRIGRIANPSQTIPFDEIIKDGLERVYRQIESRGIKVHVHPSLPDVYGDRQRLTEVLQNLIENAAKFMGASESPYIEIGLSGEENNTPIFYIKDNGIGIAPEYHEQIFGLFNKLDPRAEGTGIGLALVKRIIEFHGGRIWVESSPGQGSTFFFTLPQNRIE